MDSRPGGGIFGAVKARNLYIHVPFCAGKCAYCGFYSVGYSGGAARAFLSAVAREARARSHEASFLRTVYIGGGTPTLLPEKLLGRLLEQALSPFSLSEDYEFTVEANPESITPAKLRLLKAFGANRLSVGVQSFDDAVLARLGRRHDSRTAERALESAAGTFENLSADLILAAPGSTERTARADARKLVGFDVKHASAYILSIEAGSAFEGGRVPLPDEDTQAASYEGAARVFEGAGLLRYEVSNYARPGFECRHNLACWEGESYLGLGPSAVSYDGFVRRKNAPSLDAYLRRPESSESEAVALSPPERLRESAMLMLRTRRGVELSRPEAKAVDIDAARALAERGLVELQPDRVRLSGRGFVLADSVAVELLWKASPGP